MTVYIAEYLTLRPPNYECNAGHSSWLLDRRVEGNVVPIILIRNRGDDQSICVFEQAKSLYNVATFVKQNIKVSQPCPATPTQLAAPLAA